MYQKLIVSLVSALMVTGCAFEDVPQEDENEDIGVAFGSILGGNSLNSNGVFPNGLSSNGIIRNGIIRNGIIRNGIIRNGISRDGIVDSSTAAGDVLSALREDTQDGVYARMFLKYLVSCALPDGKSIVFDWTDSQSVAHEVIYYGALGLAPDWGIDDMLDLPTDQQEWVSACIASRTNYYGTPVVISIRGNTTGSVEGRLATEQSERDAFNKQEGAFWGNLFASPSVVKSCHNGANVAHVRSKLRECAAGHDNGEGIEPSPCGPIVRTGDCSSVCTGTPTADGAFTSCDGGKTHVITTFLD